MDKDYCHETCGTCSGPNIDDCITCKINENTIKVDNTCICKNGYYLD